MYYSLSWRLKPFQYFYQGSEVCLWQGKNAVPIHNIEHDLKNIIKEKTCSLVLGWGKGLIFEKSY